MKLEDIAARVADMQERLREKMPETASCDLEVRINYSAFSSIRFYYYISPKPEDFPEERSFQTEAELLDYLAEVDLFIERMPSRERQAQLLAGRALGKAIDAAREVGLEVDGIAESFQGVWENLIEDHSK
jgi:hypothetical protein